MSTSRTKAPLPVAPLALNYVKIVRMSLRPIGAWPGKTLGQIENCYERYSRIYLPLQGIVFTTAQAAYPIANFKRFDFFILGQMYITTFLAVVMTINEIVDKVSYYFTLYLFAIMMTGMILYNAIPMYSNYQIGAFTNNRIPNSTLTFAVYYLLPGFDMNDHFLLFTTYNLYLSFICGILVCAFDLYLSLMIFQIIGHIEILRHDLENMPAPKNEATFQLDNGDLVPISMFDDEENDRVYKNLTEYIDHHKLVVSFTDDVSNCFGPMLALYYLFHLVSGCLLLLECSTLDPDAIARYGPLAFILFGQLIQVSVIFEIVNTMSEKLIDAVYCVPWECMDKRNRRAVLLLLQRVQQPITITAMGLTTIGVQTMAAILKTTFSYFTFIRSSMNVSSA